MLVVNLTMKLSLAFDNDTNPELELIADLTERNRLITKVDLANSISIKASGLSKINDKTTGYKTHKFEVSCLN